MHAWPRQTLLTEIFDWGCEDAPTPEAEHPHGHHSKKEECNPKLYETNISGLGLGTASYYWSISSKLSGCYGKHFLLEYGPDHGDECKG